ncbi:diacylglycerol kinase (ATP) [Saccharicrinis carchari]|uniref:Diacylglycerol kinase (ATP) n=1 Tax=Saccharicrinis carchari TaxID=1168039 RepID=A0A521BAE7_SACCC|nr:diacylglycerol kinase family protein [Saccharicrinis carchari]SMO43670.1 diacylglycerol kinase (ATP) [Saccharicrinis carchari]
MNKPAQCSITKRMQSFMHAFNGLKLLFKEEHNARIHLAVAIIALTLGFVLDINTTEWLTVLLSIALVISLELLNAAIENLADFVCPQKDVRIKKIKDLAAGAVLWGAMAAFIIGGVIFVPKLWQLIS